MPILTGILAGLLSLGVWFGIPSAAPQFDPQFGALTILKVQQGGTGAATFASGECLKGNGTGPITTGACGGGSLSGGFAGMLTAWTSPSAVTATSTPTAGSFYATSTKASWLPYASTTGITTSVLYVSGITSALHLGSTAGMTTSYAGTSCTNQFVRSLNGAGTATCASVANTDLTNSTVNFTYTGMSGSASVSLGGTVSILASSSPTHGFVNASSSIATSTFNGSVTVGATAVWPHLLVGSTTPPVTNQGQWLEIWGSDDTPNGLSMTIGNTSKGTKAYSAYNLNNDRADASITNYAGLYLNSSFYSDTSFGDGSATSSSVQLTNSMGPLQFFASTSTWNGYITFTTGSLNAAQERMRITNSGDVGIATSTPAAKFAVNGNAFIAGYITSTSTTASRFPFASSTALTAGNLFFSNATGTTALYAFMINTGGARIGNNGTTTINKMGMLGTGTTTPMFNWTLATGTVVVTEGKMFSTSTKMVVDWKNCNSTSGGCQMQNIQVLATAYEIGFNNASTSGQSLLLELCNGGSTAGALTWKAPIVWATSYTQTTGANKCELLAFRIGVGTSTNTATSTVIYGTQTTFP